MIDHPIPVLVVVCSALINLNKPFAATDFFSPFIAFKIIAIHIKTTLEYSHYKTLQNDLIQRVNCGWIIKAKQQKNNCMEEQEHVFVLPCKRSPWERGRERDTHSAIQTCLWVCEGVRLDNMYYERTLPMNSWLGCNRQVPRLPEKPSNCQCEEHVLKIEKG